MNEQEQINVRNILAFLSRVQITGQEAPALVSAGAWLESLLKPAVPTPPSKAIVKAPEEKK
jgi:hypothetical protein